MLYPPIAGRIPGYDQVNTDDLSVVSVAQLHRQYPAVLVLPEYRGDGRHGAR